MSTNLRGGHQNGYGATHWYFESSDEAINWHVQVTLMAQREGLFVAGQLIPWADLTKAQRYAEKIARQSASPPRDSVATPDKPCAFPSEARGSDQQNDHALPPQEPKL